jgi:hypothetical protein
MLKSRILIVEDDAGARLGVRTYLEAYGYEIDEVDTCQAALAKIKADVPDPCCSTALPDGTALDAPAAEAQPHRRAGHRADRSWSIGAVSAIKEAQSSSHRRRAGRWPCSSIASWGRTAGGSRPPTRGRAHRRDVRRPFLNPRLARDARGGRRDAPV